MIPLNKKFTYMMGNSWFNQKDVKEAVERLKEEWRIKCRKMEIMSGEVAIFELEQLIKERFGEFK